MVVAGFHSVEVASDLFYTPVSVRVTLSVEAESKLKAAGVLLSFQSVPERVTQSYTEADVRNTGTLDQVLNCLRKLVLLGY